MSSVDHRPLPFAAQVLSRTALFYRAGADASLDRPSHVRAGSALARLTRGAETFFFVVQDDANFLAVIDARGGVDAVPLPARGGLRQFDDGRGNKKDKLDLEACFCTPDGELLVAFGSGSSSRREMVVVVHHPLSAAPRVALVHARALYRAMRDAADFSGAELNVEGAALVDDRVVFFQRGNGAPRDGRAAVDATARVSWPALRAYLFALESADADPPPPALTGVRSWSLGDVDGVPLTFTDATRTPGVGIAFLACAEASPDAVRDGPVSGVALGVLNDGTGERYLGLVADERGAVLRDKAEGLALDPADPTRAWAVVDRDDPERPAELLELRLGEAFVATAALP